MEDIIEKRDKIATEKDWMKVAQQSKKQSDSSKLSSRACAVHKCALGSESMTTILLTCRDAIAKAGCCPKRWRKMLDAILEKGKGPVIGKLRATSLIEADLQFVMSIFLN